MHDMMSPLPGMDRHQAAMVVLISDMTATGICTALACDNWQVTQISCENSHLMGHNLGKLSPQYIGKETSSIPSVLACTVAKRASELSTSTVSICLAS